jgi:predicted Rossmann fold flavoprotein
VLVLDHAARACSKVLVSGGGRCNFTNLTVTSDRYLSANPRFVTSALARFSPEDMTGLLKKHRISYFEKEAGQLFCAKSARDIVEMLLRECREAGADLRLGCKITRVAGEDGFTVSTDQGTFWSSSLVIATGGMSYAKLGASGFGYEIARQFGLAVTPVAPGLVPFTLAAGDKALARELAGVSLEAAVTCRGVTFRGSLLFTHRGLSGPPMLQASSFWKPGLALSVDLMPGVDLATLFAGERRSRIEVRNLLARHLPRRFVESWCLRNFPSRPMDQCSDKQLRSLEGLLHAWEVRPAGTEGYGNAEVTTGGVDTKGISSKTMEARDVPGLYFIGEVLDVTGQLGGYNLHWAWASGFAAGQFA